MNTRLNPKPNTRYFNSDFQLYTISHSYPSKPTTITQALKHPSWRHAMQDEFNVLEKTKIGL